MEIIGNAPAVRRIHTGLYSFDHAFVNQKGDVGFPVGKGIELYGVTNCGKSTITYGISGMIATAMSKNIALADFEGFDPDFLTTVLQASGFDGTLYAIQEDDDETALDTLLTTLRTPEYCVGILDSIGAISPVSEQEGDLGEANMGRRAFLMAQFTRKALALLRSGEPKTIFMINHAYPKIGGRGMETPGGEVKKYLASIRINVKRKYVKTGYEEYPDGSYVIEGTVVKNRWGHKDRMFNLFVLAGYGIHKGLTAMYDGMALGIIDKPDKKHRSIRIGETSFGSTKEVIMKAHDGDDKFFEPFINALDEHEDDVWVQKILEQEDEVTEETD